MEIQLEGIVREMLPVLEGEGRNGRWRKQSFVMETGGGQYPKQVCIMVWGDKIDQFRLQVGDQIVTSVDIESREFNGRWYTDVKAWKVEKKTAGAPGQSEPDPLDAAFPPVQPESGQQPTSDPFGGSSNDDDLPF
jgi:hypothetical protein